MNNNSSANSGHNNNFFGGFLLGVLVGAAVVFFLGTKKGKKLLKAISEEGADKLSDVLEKVDRKLDIDNIDEEPSFVEAVEKNENKEGNLPEGKLLAKQREIEDKPKIKRFFRGISRHAN